MNVIVEVRDHIATVTLNRPEVMNAIDPEMRQQLWETWDRIREDDDIHVAIITGAGERAFSTGSDLKKTMPPKESWAELSFGRTRANSYYLLAGLVTDKPLIAAVNGLCMGGGMAIAMACDIRIAAETAAFAVPEVKIGSFPGTGSTQKLPRTASTSSIMTMLLTGERMDAREAHKLGLVSRVVPNDRLLAEATDIARRIVANGTVAVRAIKHLVYLGQSTPLAAAMEAESYVAGLVESAQGQANGVRTAAD